MSFDKKIKEAFNGLSIGKPSESHDNIIYYADYIELVCLVTNDFVSQADIKDRLYDEGEAFSVQDNVDGEIGDVEAQINDKAESFVNTCFSYLQLRVDVYKETYPFCVDDHQGVKLIGKDKLSNKQKLYIYLLISSNLNIFSKLMHSITAEFEFLSENVLKNYLPSNAKVYGFGSNSAFTGNAQKKMRDLANILNVDTDDRIINQVSPHNSKEEGLDLVGYIPFKDENPNTIIIFGQCACGKNWFGKQNESRRYERFYKPYLNPFTFALFSPRDYTNKDHRFCSDKDLTEGQLLFERRRLLELSDDNIIASLDKSRQIVDHSIDFVEGLV